MSFSQSECQGSDTERNARFKDKFDYEDKINSIWQHIQKTKKMEPTDEQTYEMYRNKRIQQKQPNQPVQKYQTQVFKKITDHIKAKQIQSPSQQGKNESYQLNHHFTRSEYKKGKDQTSTSKYRQLQEKLQKSKQNTSILMKKLIQAQEQIQYLEYELEKEITEKQNLLNQKQTKTQRYSNQKQNIQTNSNDAQQKNNHLKALLQKYQFRLKVAQKEIQQKNTRLNQIQNQLRKVNTQLQEYKQKLAQFSLDKVVFKGCELLELNQAYKTVQRLVSLLRSTDQYRCLGNFAEQVKNIHFLSKIPKKIKSQLGKIRIGPKIKDKQTICNCTQIKINERLLWTPLLCYKKMLQMKIKYDSLNEECIEEVLFQMNKLYLSKEQSRVSKLKAFYEAEIQKLKKSNQIKYDEILAKRQIQRLKKELTSKKKHPKPSTMKSSSINSNEKLQINSISHMKSLRIVGQYEDQLKLKEKQIRLLSQRIRLLQNQASSYDKSLYLEGILWIINKILEELDSNGDEMRQFEKKFRTKIQTVTSTQDWIRLFKQFFESIQEMNHSLIQKILTIKETTVSKINQSGG